MNVVHNRGQQFLRRQFTMPPQGLNQSFFSKFLSVRVERFGDAVGVERERVAGEEMTFADRAIPVLEEAQHSAVGLESHQRIITAKQERGEMPAVRVTQALQLVVIFAKEQAGISVVGRIVIKQLVDGAQE